MYSWSILLSKTSLTKDLKIWSKRSEASYDYPSNRPKKVN